MDTFGKITIAALTAAAALGLGIHFSKAQAAGLGCQVSLQAGMSSTNSQAGVSDNSGVQYATVDGLGAQGGALGAGFGCSFAVDRILLGADVDHLWHNSSFSGSALVYNAAIDLNRQVFLTGRAGIIVNDSSLVYVRAGVTRLYTSGLTGTFSADMGDMDGKVLGGGMEMAIGKHVKLAVDYKHSWFDSKSAPVMASYGATGANLSLKPEQDLVTLQLIYALDFFGNVLPAK